LTAAAKDGDAYALTFTKGTARITAATDAGGKLTSWFMLWAESPTLTAAGTKMLSSVPPDHTMFSANFVNQVPYAHMDAYAEQIAASMGAFKSFDATPAGYVATFEKGKKPVKLLLDKDGKVDFVLFP
jgi:hypothetical protein